MEFDSFRKLMTCTDLRSLWWMGCRIITGNMIFVLERMMDKVLIELINIDQIIQNGEAYNDPGVYC